jgi:hypothetical protein
MVTQRPAQGLLGRHRERQFFDQSLAAVRAGQSAVLVVRGEPGVGKTALLEYAVESARGFRVARTIGVESEIELPFAGLQQLCAPVLERAERLPTPQRDALGVACRPESRAGAESVPGRIRRAEPFVGTVPETTTAMRRR